MNDFSRQVSNKDARGMPMGIVLLPESLTGGGVWVLVMKPFTKMNFHISNFFTLQSTMEFGLIFLFSFKYIYVGILRVSGYHRIPGLTHTVSMFLFVSMFFSIRRKCCKELQNSETKGKMGTRWISLLFSSLQRR